METLKTGDDRGYVTVTDAEVLFFGERVEIAFRPLRELSPHRIEAIRRILRHEILRMPSPPRSIAEGGIDASDPIGGI